MSSKKQFPKMPWYPSNFYAATRTWPFMARAVYRELLDIEWEEGGIPADPERLREILGVDSKLWKRAWAFVEPKFEICDDGLLRNPRLEAHRTHAHHVSGVRSDAANKRHGNVVPIKPRGPA